MDATIQFEQLTQEVILMVVDKFVSELDVLLAEKKVTIELSDAARKWLADKGTGDDKKLAMKLSQADKPEALPEKSAEESSKT